MTYRVEITDNAEREAHDIHARIAEDSPLNAQRWADSLADVIFSLETFPLRGPVAPESEAISEEIRQIIFGQYRILYVVRGQVVFVLHIRHGARLAMDADEVQL